MGASAGSSAAGQTAAIPVRISTASNGLQNRDEMRYPTNGQDSTFLGGLDFRECSGRIAQIFRRLSALFSVSEKTMTKLPRAVSTAPGTVYYCTSTDSAAMVLPCSVPSTFAITSVDAGLVGSAARSARFLTAADAFWLPAASSLYTLPETSRANDVVAPLASQPVALCCLS